MTIIKFIFSLKFQNFKSSIVGIGDWEWVH